ncbi:MAG TPA: cation:dicarboxylase symporter family transporter, partial [Myxococcota bacterium]|nr:cation:dicarboxylase symporter family transporter [Myxococcota bacterium]
WWEHIAMIALAVIAAIGNAGVPMGCFFLASSILASKNIPIHLMGSILPLYAFIDMVETSLNVWSDVIVAKIVDEEAKETATAAEPALTS